MYQFVNVKLIAREMLPRLIENLVMPNLCHKDYSDTFANLGDTIQVRKPTKLTAVDFNPATGTTDQDIKEESVDVKLDKLATVDVGIGAVEAATNLENLQQQVIEPAAEALAEKINADGLKMYTQFAAIGTAGTTPDGLDDFAKARKYLNKNKVPMRYTPYRGLDAVTNWVKLKFTTMNLKKLALWKSFCSFFFNLFHVISPRTAAARGLF